MKQQDKSRNVRNVILVNPAPHGIGPILNSADMAQELYNLLKEKNSAIDYEILLPEPKNKSISVILLNEIFANSPVRGHVWLSPKFGEILGRFGFSSDDYVDRLRFIASKRRDAEYELIASLKSGLGSYNLANPKAKQRINAGNILCGINHNPILRPCTDNSFPMFCTSIGLFSEILRHAEEIIPRYKDKAIKKIVDACIKEAKLIEDSQALIMVAEPSALSYRKFRKNNRIIGMPPFARTLAESKEVLKQGVYLNISGIEPVQKQIVSLAKPFLDAGYAVYYPPSYKQGIKGGIAKAPVENGMSIFSNPAIIAAIGRMGWGSVWASMMNGSPFITYEYDDKEDPEMHHNVKTLEQIGLGIVMKKGDNPKSVMVKALALRPNIGGYISMLQKKYGTLYGIEYAAKQAFILLS